MKIISNICRKLAAAHYLSEEPDNIQAALVALSEANDDVVASEFIEVWKPFEDYTVKELLDQIDDLSMAFKEMYVKGLRDGEVKMKKKFKKE